MRTRAATEFAVPALQARQYCTGLVRGELEDFEIAAAEAAAALNRALESYGLVSQV
jgi:hypothetical protein